MTPVVLCICAIACIVDVRTRRIPNALTIGTAVAGVAYHLAVGGLPGAGASLAGFALGLAIMLPWFVLGGMGAGDVKLVAGLGAWLGPASTLYMLLFTAVAGGMLALAVSLAHGYVRTAILNLYRLLAHWAANGPRPYAPLTLDQAAGPRLAYAIPIAVGTVVTLWAR